MGTWNYGPFDNDHARDAVRQLANGTFRMDKFRFACRELPLDSGQAEVVVALVAVMNGNLPSEEFHEALAFEFSFRDRRWLEHQVRELMSSPDSDLYEQWLDAGELEQWLAATRRATGFTGFADA
ncbi:hypothetical protein CKJ81_11395 [Corynebacterium hadale]|uniref:DUF4259 domain-containing protein n=1 Tax=Corynebacterium hadale TaxID=2026255 RepID=A0ABX4H6V3_9CORY|nr:MULTISPECIES: DUF4259 domain-containing protein [Corynebacterium]MCG7254347.1 DUF4259 domain-containing protein [Corynebacterium hadale]MCG7256552.1 DUF4259 domain-containing protein [Corynebacterium hadale]MCG7265303.1 DUF4259 domain-containing protein [Corynebacterium hadale]PAT02860.1 hypothetical protein CKJ85_11145 [Corynebacterium sp. NML 150383]PAT05010.1 hypothetical protein CKJ81_11395 [Corynebacterium hadale]